ncbi:hypothetical protein [Singulisphaera sp. PoT]|uniref:hypothetical protein n=1 Tax=Singulisphaera sp. PoT TaxID=3411797 RepID=UPI003BF5EFF6
METSLHRELKERYAESNGGRSEVVLKGFRVDALSADGTVVEVQCGALGPLRPKLRSLLSDHVVQVVKPVVVARRVVRRARRDGADVSARFSPKRGQISDVFEDLVGLIRLFPHPNLRLDVLAVEIDEVRVPRRRWPGYLVVDRSLRVVCETKTLRAPEDLLGLLPDGLPDPFTTLDLAEHLERSVPFAQRVAYCLRLAGAVESIGKIKNRHIYGRPSPATDDRALQATAR